jgi:hypothetical protein
VRETLEGTLGTLDSALEGLEVGDTVDEALLGALGEVRSALEDVLEHSDRAMEEATQTALGEGRPARRRRPPRPHPIAVEHREVPRASGFGPTVSWYTFKESYDKSPKSGPPNHRGGETNPC